MCWLFSRLKLTMQNRGYDFFPSISHFRGVRTMEMYGDVEGPIWLSIKSHAFLWVGNITSPKLTGLPLEHRPKRPKMKGTSPMHPSFRCILLMVEEIRWSPVDLGLYTSQVVSRISSIHRMLVYGVLWPMFYKGFTFLGKLEKIGDSKLWLFGAARFLFWKGCYTPEN